jgi:DNA-directed RNA polymerase alpha subunit
MKEPTAAEREVRLKIATQLARHWTEQSAFSGRGLSNRTVEAIVACGIYEPERLLFMTEEQIAAIPGIGKASLKAIRAYRSRFLK